jgi:TP901 family phage tail tape measure protein
MKTIKELDSVMTETAVVTDFSIGDMWNKLPEYSTKASQLGASIKDLYSATTLYYQQGLNSEQAMGIGVETMKMARIAGMDASEATQAMTAALRGFNMEINEMSATKVNDVYSELAAITASDTAQIATAMSKTASIAANANMEFETTAALLAQIIETTQEAPETAGTAMKTIIARFSEVKSLFDEGMLSGKDGEGEEININKIDTALKKVGISLNDFLTG